MQRHVLFYSNYCSYSKEVINSILQKNLRHLFVLVCTDLRAASLLPDFVDRVPLVFTVDRRILTDAAVQAFVDNMAQYFSGMYTPLSTRQEDSHSHPQPSSAPQQRQQQDPTDQIAAWSVHEMGAKGISDKFSFLDSADAFACSHISWTSIHPFSISWRLRTTVVRIRPGSAAIITTSASIWKT
jgi:hypothetical protein